LRHYTDLLYSACIAERSLEGCPLSISPFAGKVAPKELLIDVQKLVAEYYDHRVDVNNPAQQVAFGTSGHRGTSLNGTFNRCHILAATQAVCDYRKKSQITGPLYVGIDTHALSIPALETALEVLTTNGVETFIQENGGFTPTPVISHAILNFNRGRTSGFADGIVITPSHNPPQDGGFKYNPPNGGPADTDVTSVIEKRANELLVSNNRDVKILKEAKTSSHLHAYDFVTPYVDDLENVIDLKIIRESKLKIGVDPMGGANIGFWDPIVKKYGIQLEVVNRVVDPTFSFMTVDHDGKIRMDCSSPYAMAKLVGLKDKYDVAFGNDTDSDRHGIVTRSAGLMNPNHYLAVAISYLFTHRTDWKKSALIGKTAVSSSMIDRVAGKIGREVCEVPVGFKWFVEGLLKGDWGFCGEESAGGSFLRRNGSVWTTDKDGIILGLLAAEISAKTGRDPGEHYREFTKEFGDPVYERLDAPADEKTRKALKNLTPEKVKTTTLAGEPILQKQTQASGNGASLGGLKVISENGWFAVRPSGTENIYKIYTESFKGKDHLLKIQAEAKQIVDAAVRD
jgi:phosphoglucomutase